MPVLSYLLEEKQDSKKGFVRPIGPNNFGIIFTLLAELIAI